MTLLGIDVGTTHLKVGAFDRSGRTLQTATRAMAVQHAPEGYAYFEPEEVWQQAASAIQVVTSGLAEPVAAVGIASMAETGLLVGRRSGQAQSVMLPWFDTAAQPQADALLARMGAELYFTRAGLLPSYKCSLAKLLWLQAHDPAALEDAVWLSTADYLAFRLTGVFATDYSLASRTCAFNITRRVWETDWLRDLGLPADLFPPAQAAGMPAGVTTATGRELGLLGKVPVAVCGHDHVCGAFAAGATSPGMVFDSMGTAEALIGALPARPLTSTDYAAGLMIGCHTAPDSNYWMGGLSTSGGAVEWLRRQLAPEALSYAELLALLDSAPAGPTGILFFPYLLGSASPHRDPHAPAAWIGLRAGHTRADLAKAVLEGAAFELAFVQQVGQVVIGQPIDVLTVAGGGTRNRHWLQIKADVSGCTLRVCAQPEVVLLGATLLAGQGSGLAVAYDAAPAEIIHPDPAHHQIYRDLYEGGFLRLQEALRGLGPLFKRWQ